MRAASKRLFQHLIILIQLVVIKTKIDWGNIIIATKRGLYQLKDKKLRIIQLGEFYGVTIVDDKLYVLNKVSEKEAHIVAYQLLNNKIQKQSRNIVIHGLDEAIHQIDFFNNTLYLTDTHNNRILAFTKKGKKINQYYPLGEINNGRGSPNYGHINSIFSDLKHVYLVCHNNSVHSGKTSEILKTDMEFNVLNKITTSSQSAHNVILYQGKLYHCDSLNSLLKVDDKPLFQTMEFTRGLAMTNDKIIVGDSNYAKRKDRSKSKGSIYLLNHDGKLIEKLMIPGMIQEIRVLGEKDYGLSSS